MVDTGGNVGETFKRMGSEEGLTQTFTTVLTAGALEYLGNIPFGENGVKLGSINGKSPFTDQLGKNLIYGVTGAAVRSGITGESFEDQLPAVFALALLQSGAASAAFAIGDTKSLSSNMNLFLHTVVGCGVGAIKQDSSDGCAPGAMGALVAKVWAKENDAQIRAESATPEDANKTILDQSTFAGTIAGCIVGGSEGCSTGGMTGNNAILNNHLTEIERKKLQQAETDCYTKKDQSACATASNLKKKDELSDKLLANAVATCKGPECNEVTNVIRQEMAKQGCTPPVHALTTPSSMNTGKWRRQRRRGSNRSTLRRGSWTVRPCLIWASGASKLSVARVKAVWMRFHS
jgi:hypothetical protein